MAHNTKNATIKYYYCRDIQVKELAKPDHTMLLNVITLKT
jgi:hypothetical protein